MSDAFVGGDAAKGEDFMGDVFLALDTDAVDTLPRPFWLASEPVRGFVEDVLTELTVVVGALAPALTRLLSGVPELELSSSSVVRCRFPAALVGLATTSARMVSLSLSLSLSGSLGRALTAGDGLAFAFESALSLGALEGTAAAATLDLARDSGTSSSELESETNSLESTRPAFVGGTFVRGFVGDTLGEALGVAAAAAAGFLELESSRLACASDAESFFFPVAEV